MRKSLAILLSIALFTLLPSPSSARPPDPFAPEDDVPRHYRPPIPVPASTRLSTSAAPETTWVGFNPEYASHTNSRGELNYWSIGVGAFRPPAGSNNARRGYWDWDTPIHGDSLQGWWPVRFPYSSPTGLSANDALRQWQACDIGNSANYVMNQGAGYKRTMGVVGVWHADPGNVITSSQAGTNPHAPAWTPLGGTRSAWCGLRGHGDRTAIDPITGNPITVEALPVTWDNGNGPNGLGTSRQFPGYAGLWDQMLYTDVPVPTAGTLKLKFSLRTRMSTGKVLTTSRLGWFNYDPLTNVAGNFLSASANPAQAPIDSFQVYVGRPIEPVVGPNNDFVGSDGASHEIFDPLRRWLSEVIAIQGGSAANSPHWEYGVAGDYSGGPIELSIPASQLTPYGSTVRIVFRTKTNKFFDDDHDGSTGVYNSGYMGAVQLDDVQVDGAGTGYTMIGTFEPGDPVRDNIDNTQSASAAWRSTGKPPATYSHVADLSTLGYVNLCSSFSNSVPCDMMSHVVTIGDADHGDYKNGPFGSADQEVWNGFYSPTINLVAPGPDAPNEMGITGNIANATEDMYLVFDIDEAAANALQYGLFFLFTAQSYPAAQEDGTKCWSDLDRYIPMFDSQTQTCERGFIGLRASSMIMTTNPGEQPDSLRIGLRKQAYCYRFQPPDCAPGNLALCWDNVSLAFVDSPTPTPTAFNPDWLQDAFPANENAGLVGTAAFDTCAAWVRSGNQLLPPDDPDCRRDIAGDTAVVSLSGSNARVDLVFRINPGVGNYHTLGDPSSGLRAVPTNPAVVTSSDGTFWSEYIKDNGAFGTGGNGTSGPGHNPALGTGPNFPLRWDPLVWNSARCDTVDLNVFPVAALGIGQTAVGAGAYCAMYHESDPKFGTLGKLKNRCFLWDTAGATDDLSCGGVNELHPYPPAWITALPHSRTGWDGNLQTRECTKILPDGLFTPGTHVEYFFRCDDPSFSGIALLPDTSRVYPHNEEDANADGHRWREFNVLPDAWKFSAYGGLGQACMLYVDWDDGGGDDRVWRSVADSIGATRAEKRGAGNGWSARGDLDVNDPSGFVYANQQPGTTWDIYNVTGGADGASAAGSIGSRDAQRTPCVAGNDLQAGKDARNAPTGPMLQAYYDLLLITTGNLSSDIFGPFISIPGLVSGNRTAQDRSDLKSFLFASTAGHPRGLFLLGSGAMQSLDPGTGVEPDLQANLGADLVGPDWQVLSGNPSLCPELIASAAITPSGDVYGLHSECPSPDVLAPVSGEAVALEYEGGLGAAILKTPSGSNHWIALTSGVRISDIRSRFCESSYGRLAFFHDVFANVFGSLCTINGDASITLDVPNNPGGKAFTDFMGLRNNPLRSGSAVIRFGLSRPDRVTVKIYDVTGRLVRTLASHQLFAAGDDHELTWDGVDDAGRLAARGVYFSAFETDGGRSYERKITLLK